MAKQHITYRVEITTGNVTDGGTDSDVFIQIHSATGYTGWHELNTSGNDFEKGETDVFDLAIPDIGAPILVKIKFVKGTAVGQNDWFLEQVGVTHGGIQRIFPYSSWITHASVPASPVKYVTLYPENPAKDFHTYKILTKTGHRETDDDIRVRLHSNSGSTRFALLDTDEHEASAWSYYEVNLRDIGLPTVVDSSQLESLVSQGFGLEMMQIFYGNQTVYFGSMGWAFDDKAHDALAEHPILIEQEKEESDWKIAETFLKGLAVGLLGKVDILGEAFGAILFAHLIKEEVSGTDRGISLTLLGDVIDEANYEQTLNEALGNIKTARTSFLNDYMSEREVGSSREALKASLEKNQDTLKLAIGQLMNEKLVAREQSLAAFLEASLFHLYLLQEEAAIDPICYGKPYKSSAKGSIEKWAKTYHNHIVNTKPRVVDYRVDKISGVSRHVDDDGVYFFDGALSGKLEKMDWNLITSCGWKFQKISVDDDYDVANQYIDDYGLNFYLEGDGDGEDLVLDQFRGAYITRIAKDLTARLDTLCAETLETLETLQTDPLPDKIPVYPREFVEYSITSQDRTLLNITLNQYGTARYWPVIQKWNRSFAPDPMARVAPGQRTLKLAEPVKDQGPFDVWITTQLDDMGNVIKSYLVNNMIGYRVDLGDKQVDALGIAGSPENISIPKEIAGVEVFLCVVDTKLITDEKETIDQLLQQLGSPFGGAPILSKRIDLAPVAPRITLFVLARHTDEDMKVFDDFANVDRFDALKILPLAIGTRARVRTTPVEGKMEYLHLRSQPRLGSQEDVQNKLPNGEIVTILDGPKFEPDGSNLGDQDKEKYVWWKILRRDGQTGWVAEYDRDDRVLTLVRPPNINPLRPGIKALVHTTANKKGFVPNLNLREQPGTDAAEVGKLPNGEIVTIVEGPVEKGGYVWWKVARADGQEGWSIEYAPGDTVNIISLYDLRIGDSAYANTTPGPQGPVRLNVRKEPNAKAKEMYKLYNGDRVMILDGPSSNDDGLVWWLVRCPDGTEGWATAYVPGDFTHTLIGLHGV
jgi:hypothetical protein